MNAFSPVHPMEGEPSTRRSARSPRLWCPGRVFISSQGDLRLGRAVGYSSQAPSFQGLRCGYRGKLEAWAHVAWLVPRDALNTELAVEHGAVLPESFVDRDALPHAHRWLHEQPLLCVSARTWQRLAGAGVRVYRVALGEAGERVLEVDATGGKAERESLAVTLRALESATANAWDGRKLTEVQGDPLPIDRALRMISGGVLDASAVLNALDAKRLVDDCHGHHGALEGHLRQMGSVGHDLRPVDALFGQIFERAAAMRAVTEELLTALAHASPEASAVAVPLYDSACSVDLPPLCVPRVRRLIVGGSTRPDLELPSERRWLVQGADSWSPQLPAGFAESEPPAMVS